MYKTRELLPPQNSRLEAMNEEEWVQFFLFPGILHKRRQGAFSSLPGGTQSKCCYNADMDINKSFSFIFEPLLACMHGRLGEGYIHLVHRTLFRRVVSALL